MSVVFDTLKLADRLEAGGFTAIQAKTASSAFSEAFAADLATKTDLKTETALLRSGLETETALIRTELETEAAHIRSELKSEMALVRTELKSEMALARTEMRMMRQELKADIANARADTTRWIVGAIGFQTVVTIGAIVTLLKLFIK